MEINRCTCDIFVREIGKCYTAMMPFIRFTLVSAMRRRGRSRDVYIGLQFHGSVKSPDLGNNITVPFDHTFGKIPVLIDVQNIQHKISGILLIT